MEQGRILILGQSKENSYEIRNLLDNHRFELEIALSKEMGKTILSSRKMHLLIVHTEMVDEGLADFFESLEEDGIHVPLLLVGEEAGRLGEQVRPFEPVGSFEKPYPVDELIGFIRKL